MIRLWLFTVAGIACAQSPLARHDFLYAGEAKTQNIQIVRSGKVAWSYTGNARGEISDAVRMTNGNILYAHQYGIKLISPEKQVLWSYDAPEGTEIHTAQPIGDKYVVFVMNGDPLLVRVVNIQTNKLEREFPLPVGNPKSVHGQLRHARVTPAGTLLVAHMDMAKVVEYSSEGKPLWSFETPRPWSAERLKNGNTLITGGKNVVQEVSPAGHVVWHLEAEDIPEHKITGGFQIAVRLANGNTIVNNWFNSWSGTVDRANPPLQALEVTPGKKVVWVLRSWSDPADLGPSTTIQLLNEPGTTGNIRFGAFR